MLQLPMLLASPAARSGTFSSKALGDQLFRCTACVFDNLSSLLVKTREEQQKDAENGTPAVDRMLLSRTSPLGTFVRRAQLEFIRLQLNDTMVLWKSFITYREPTLPMWKKRNAAACKTSFDVNLRGVG
jgi:anaphase-promoting complex subunit 5